jgi:myo-inositol-1(or 4)-monophosphatase
MDKSKELSKKPFASIIHEIKTKIADSPIMALNIEKEIFSSRKEDQSLVTEMDFFISKSVEDIVSSQFPNYHFFSEENHLSLKFPAIILDPIDGTNEFIKKIPECALSLAFCNEQISPTHVNNFAWIYNFFTGFEISTLNRPVGETRLKGSNYLGLVSRTEWNKGNFLKFREKCEQNNINVAPRGSIAFKLALLAAGACDFVITLEPKNIWDIAAGTILCEQRGLSFYQHFQ